MSTLQRRHFLQGALAQVSLASIFQVLGCRKEDGNLDLDCEPASSTDGEWDQASPEERVVLFLEAYFGLEGQSHAAEIGVYVLENEGEEQAIETFACDVITGASSLEEAMDEVKEQLDQDLDSWNVVNLQGWVLADIEVTLCGLAQLAS